jgi:hypothetical protein
LLRICALILCALAALTLDSTPMPRTQAPWHAVESFSLITIQIDRSQRVVLPEVSGALLP